MLPNILYRTGSIDSSGEEAPINPLGAPVFFPERRNPFLRLLMTPLMARLHNGGDEKEPETSEDDLDLRLPKLPRRHPPPPGAGIKLWQLLVVLFALFAAHYKLVELTVAGTSRDIRSEIALAQSKGDSRYDDAMRRLQQLENERSGEGVRMATMEAVDDRQDRELIELRINQRAVMRKLNIQP